MDQVATLPTIAQIEVLHRKYAASDAMYEWVYGHCQAVWMVAEQLIDVRSLDIDRELVRVGCLLHDIGVYRLFNAQTEMIPGVHYITHGMQSEEILRSEGFDERLWRFGSHHTGVGLTTETIIAQNLPLPHVDFLAETPEERLVMYADKFHSKKKPPVFNSYESYRQQLQQFGDEKPAQFDALAAEFGRPDLVPLAMKLDQSIA